MSGINTSLSAVQESRTALNCSIEFSPSLQITLTNTISLPQERPQAVDCTTTTRTSHTHSLAYLLAWRARFAAKGIAAANLKGKDRLQESSTIKKARAEARAISFIPKIGARGFEPPTPWSRTTFSRDRALSHTQAKLGPRQVVGDEWLLQTRGGSRASAISRMGADIHRITHD